MEKNMTFTTLCYLIKDNKYLMLHRTKKNADINAGKYVIYNIAGQRLDAPQKGLNIINGRKVMIK